MTALDQQPLQITGLSASRYVLKIDGIQIGVFTREELATGLNLAMLETPMLKQARLVHAATVAHNDVSFTRRRTIEPRLRISLLPADKTLALLDAAEEELVHQQRLAARPVPHRYEVVPRTDQ